MPLSGPAAGDHQASIWKDGEHFRLLGFPDCLNQNHFLPVRLAVVADVDPVADLYSVFRDDHRRAAEGNFFTTLPPPLGRRCWRFGARSIGFFFWGEIAVGLDGRVCGVRPDRTPMVRRE